MNNEKLSPSIVCIIVLLVALTVISSYLLLKINNMLRGDSVVTDHYELAVIDAKGVSLNTIENDDETSKLSLVPIGDLTNYKIEFKDGNAFLTVLNKNGCIKLFNNNIDEIKVNENEKIEIKGFKSKVVYAYIDYESQNKDIYFLMNDGLIEHATLRNILTNDEPKSDGPIPDIKNFVNILPCKTENGHALVALTSDNRYVVLNETVN